MKFLKVKIVLILITLVFVLFFFDDYDIIYVEKTAIITAVAIDYNDEKTSLYPLVQTVIREMQSIADV